MDIVQCFKINDRRFEDDTFKVRFSITDRSYFFRMEKESFTEQKNYQGLIETHNGDVELSLSFQNGSSKYIMEMYEQSERWIGIIEFVKNGSEVKVSVVIPFNFIPSEMFFTELDGLFREGSDFHLEVSLDCEGSVKETYDGMSVEKYFIDSIRLEQ